MALSPEIQAAIEKGLEQITDLNALQDALKVLDPSGQLQTQQEENTPEEVQQEPTSDTSDEIKEEPVSDLPNEQSKEVVSVKQGEEEANIPAPIPAPAQKDANKDVVQNKKDELPNDKKSNSAPSLSELVADEMSPTKNTNDKSEEDKKPGTWQRLVKAGQDAFDTVTGKKRREKRDREREKEAGELTDRMTRDGMYDSNQSYAFLKDYFAQINEDYQGLINDK